MAVHGVGVGMYVLDLGSAPLNTDHAVGIHGTASLPDHGRVSTQADSTEAEQEEDEEEAGEDEGKENEVEEEEQEEAEETPTNQDDEDREEVEDVAEGVAYQPMEVAEAVVAQIDHSIEERVARI